ncbi:hypothetical protein R3W88_015251 [Solanum pinnatisectum]|uniref:Annexin n=1 Tax=Solanum pinnatisectum TaxID=50273 RepID=A0AAV9KUP2_9SOLN|nr:hypothetical protein R3W88_015251 [Solanum pinnatisectum]
MAYVDETFSGWGTNEACIIKILGHRNAAQRKLIRETYEKDLLQDLDGEISGDFQRVVHLWTMAPAERDACLAYEAIKHLPGSNCIIMEIACARSSVDLFKVRQSYQAWYKKLLEEDVADHSTGDFRKLLVSLVTALRYEGEEVNMELASDEAKILHEKIFDKAYDMRANPKDQYLTLLRSAIKCLMEPEKYFEKVLRLAMKGFGTDEESLTRVVATRAEVEMELIKEKYYKRNSVTLESAISDDTSGDYEKNAFSLNWPWKSLNDTSML